MLLAVLTISLAASTLVMISSVRNAIPVDDKLNPLENTDEEKHLKKKGAAKSMVFGNHSKSIA
jgi:hypothetical protein